MLKFLRKFCKLRNGEHIEYNFVIETLLKNYDFVTAISLNYIYILKLYPLFWQNDKTNTRQTGKPALRSHEVTARDTL